MFLRICFKEKKNCHLPPTHTHTHTHTHTQVWTLIIFSSNQKQFQVFKIAKLEFKIAVQYGLWTKCTHLQAFNSLHIGSFQPKYSGIYFEPLNFLQIDGDMI